MKFSYLIIIILTLFFSSCKVTAPQFKSIGQWQISKVSADKVILTNTAKFYNPNTFDGLKVNQINIQVKTNEKMIGSVNTSESVIKIPKQSDFDVPLSFNINPKDLLGNLGSILEVALGKSINLRCIGDIKVGYSAFSKSISLDQTVPINLKDISSKF